MKRYIKATIGSLANESYELQEELVCSKDTTPDMLMDLINSKYTSVRYDIVWHDNVTEEILIKLADDRSIDVQKAVATNPKTPSDISDPLYQKLADQGYF